MQILTASQVHEWDQYTIANEPISSIDLMERAARACVDWLVGKGYGERNYSIFCGKGNNGGDGLAIARMLSQTGQSVIVNILEFGHKGTADFQHNLASLHLANATIRFISSPAGIQPVPQDDIIIDAIFGSGLNRAPSDLNAAVIEHINQSGCEVISIDIPSGISADSTSKAHSNIIAHHTLSFQQYKLAFLAAENEPACGEVHILDIRLHPGYMKVQRSNKQLVDLDLVKSIYKKRKNFGHKGTYGHALIVAGSYGKVGAAILATRSCLRSGAGLCTVHVPGCGYEIMQIACPEAMTETDEVRTHNSSIPADIEKYSAIGIGPGLGLAEETRQMLRTVISKTKKPIVIDADGLNLLANDKPLLEKLPAGSILTPHPKEFERLFGKSDNDFNRMQKASEQARSLNLTIILKGHFTLVATPSGECYFNTTGNSGMATGGTGDALTGILTGLLAQQYSPEDAAILGVYIHGLAGDLAADVVGKEALIASDLIKYLGKAFLQLGGKAT